jgi:putative tricarboxylic transport membrane protein
VYTVRNNVFDIVLVVVFGLLGYLMKKFGFDPGPLVLAFVLGSLLESSLRRSLLLFDGDPTGFLTRPISGTLLLLLAVVIVLPLTRALWRWYRGRVGGRGSGSGGASGSGDGGGSGVGEGKSEEPAGRTDA